MKKLHSHDLAVILAVIMALPSVAVKAGANQSAPERSDVLGLCPAVCGHGNGLLHRGIELSIARADKVMTAPLVR